MPAILGILKVIGILLLILLGILLLLIILVLFCPIIYKLKGAKAADSEEEASEDSGTFSLQVSAKWLLGLMGLRYSYPDSGAFKVKLLCFTLYDSSKPSGKASQSEASEPNAQNAETTDHLPQDTATTASTPEVQTAACDSAQTAEDIPVASEGADPDKVTADTEAASDVAETASDSDTKQEGTATKQTLPEKLKFLYHEFCFYRDFWNQRETQELLKKVIFRCKKIIVSILPRKLEAQMLVGTGEPDTTGYVMAVYGMLLPYLGNKVSITADFEKKILEGHFKAKGHICIFTLLRHSISVLLDKNLRIVYKRFKKHKAKVAAATKDEAANVAQTADKVTSAGGK